MIRTETADAITVYAGTPEELAAIADAYAAGARPCPRGYDPDLFRRAALYLRTGCPACDLGAVRFYADRPDGAPYRGPFAPDPDPGWIAQQRAIGVRV